MKVINQYISVSDKKKNATAEIYIYGDIADSKWFDEDVTPKEIKDALNEIKDKGTGLKTIELHINSAGGSCYAGNAIFNLLDGYRNKNEVNIKAYIDGIAASMASGIACVADEVFAAENALFMIHKPILLAQGNANDLEKCVLMLNKVEDSLVKNYMRKFNGTEDKLREMLADETWLSADEAKEFGFVDEIVAPIEIAASAKGIKIGDTTFTENIPNFIKDKYASAKIKGKEEKAMEYDNKLMDYGIDEEMFNSIGIESATILDVLEKAKTIKAEPVEQFIDKQIALTTLNCTDITADELLNYAKSWMDTPNIETLKQKANCYDEIVTKAREDAMENAIRAKGDNYNEARVKKMLDALDYTEILEQSNEWQREAENALHAGIRKSVPEKKMENKRRIKPEDYKI